MNQEQLSRPICSPTTEDVKRWVRAILTMSGIKSMQFGDGTVGLVDVPMKYARAIDGLTAGLEKLAAGQPLPRLVPLDVTAPNPLARPRKATRK